jgi:hypothetical protein
MNRIRLAVPQLSAGGGMIGRWVGITVLVLLGACAKQEAV